MNLTEKIHARRAGIRLYGLTPPKRDMDRAKVEAVAAKQAERLAALGPDGLILYDLQDEAGRTDVARPFPFLPTIEPLEYARGPLAATTATASADSTGSIGPTLSAGLPKVLYRCVGNLDREGLIAWAREAEGVSGRDACVLVGSASARNSGSPGLALPDAYALLRAQAPSLCVGGVAIAERHARKQDEGTRLLVKYHAGCRFFVSQTVYDAAASKALMSDYSRRFAEAGLETPPLMLSFSPCGSHRTLDFLRWLGVSVPAALDKELRQSPDILAKSIELAEAIAGEVAEFARGQGIALGMNVESISIRKEEIDAAGRLYHVLSRILGRD